VTLEPWPNDLAVVPGEVIGWRAWRVVVRREPQLMSLFYDIVWPTDDWLAAETMYVGQEEPHGICAARDREHLAGMHQYFDPSAPRYVENWGREFAAIGEVGLSGKIIPGERGYRAEKARVLSIVLPYAAWELVEPLRRAYRVPVSLANILTKTGGLRGHRA